MNDNGLPGDPLGASQFSIPGITRFALNMRADRTYGEYFPQIGGDFLRVATCDYPARISFNNGDFSQSIPLLSGIGFSGRFTGVTIWHDNLSNAGWSVALPLIVFELSRGNTLIVDNQVGATAIPLPYTLATAVTSSTIIAPAPLGYKVVDISAEVKVSAAAAPTPAVLAVAMLDIAGQFISGAAVVRNSINFNSITANWRTKAIAPIQVGATQYAYDIDLRDIPIPSAADRIRMFLSFPAVTSNDTNEWAIFAR